LGTGERYGVADGKRASARYSDIAPPGVSFTRKVVASSLGALEKEYERDWAVAWHRDVDVLAWQNANSARFGISTPMATVVPTADRAASGCPCTWPPGFWRQSEVLAILQHEI
jgi:hypothetical protein